MSLEFVDAIVSLGRVVDEENDRLTLPFHHPDLPELVGAKVRLVGIIEAEAARLARTCPDWWTRLPESEHAMLSEAVGVLVRRLEVNAQLLGRRIELCDELIGAIVEEAQRLSGARSAVYGVRGTLRSTRIAAPISINSQL